LSRFRNPENERIKAACGIALWIASNDTSQVVSTVLFP
jgi:hypothetical protein